MFLIKEIFVIIKLTKKLHLIRVLQNVMIQNLLNSFADCDRKHSGDMSRPFLKSFWYVLPKKGYTLPSLTNQALKNERYSDSVFNSAPNFFVGVQLVFDQQTLNESYEFTRCKCECSLMLMFSCFSILFRIVFVVFRESFL